MGGDKVLTDNGVYVDFPSGGLPIIPIYYKDLRIEIRDSDIRDEILAYPEGIYMMKPRLADDMANISPSVIVYIYSTYPYTTDEKYDLSKIVRVENRIDNEILEIYQYKNDHGGINSSYSVIPGEVTPYIVSGPEISLRIVPNRLNSLTLASNRATVHLKPLHAELIINNAIIAISTNIEYEEVTFTLKRYIVDEGITVKLKYGETIYFRYDLGLLYRIYPI